MSKSMECTTCQDPTGNLKGFPFEIQDTLLRNPYDHKDVHIHKCRSCGSLYVGLGIQAFDDNISYWVPVSSTEIQELKQLRETPGVFTAAKQLIESKAFHIFGDRDGKYYYKKEPAVVLSGLSAW